MDRPTLMNAAGWMALPIGFMWSASFLCTMYGTDHPFVSILGTALGFISIYMLYKQLTNYRRLFPSSWLHILHLSFVTCLLAGLLTDAAQYIYFLYLDNGRLISSLQREEYIQLYQQVMPQMNIDELQQMINNISTRDIVIQMVIYNVLLALPASLFAALPVRAPRSSSGGETNSNKQ